MLVPILFVTSHFDCNGFISLGCFFFIKALINDLRDDFLILYLSDHTFEQSKVLDKGFCDIFIGVTGQCSKSARDERI